MRVFYDTEFLEDGRTIELISIGMVAEDGRELYLVNLDAPWKRIKKNQWLMANVVPQLPQVHSHQRPYTAKRWPIDIHDPVVYSRAPLADAVRSFLLATPDLELWADHAAYDHVVLAQLFGRMIDLPIGVPMWTNDVQQEKHRRGNPSGRPIQQDGQHNALQDARHVKATYEWLSNQDS